MFFKSLQRHHTELNMGHHKAFQCEKGHPNHPNCLQRIIESLLAPAFQHIYVVLCFGVGHGTWWPQGASFRVRRYFDVAKGNVVPLQAFHQASPLILWCFHQRTLVKDTKGVPGVLLCSRTKVSRPSPLILCPPPLVFLCFFSTWGGGHHM